jgi:hypothetical protein
MKFSKLAQLLAIAGFVLGLSQILLGIAVATEFFGPYEVFQPRYLGSRSSGEAINWGGYAILLAVALGTLAEISFSLRKRSDEFLLRSDLTSTRPSFEG